DYQNASEIQALPTDFSGTTPMSGFVDAFSRTVNGFRGRLNLEGINTTAPSERDVNDLQQIVNYHPAEHVPVFDMLATEFGVATKWFSAFPGNTWVNRTIAYTGGPAQRSLGDDKGDVIVDNDMPIDEVSFIRKLD